MDLEPLSLTKQRSVFRVVFGFLTDESPFFIIAATILLRRLEYKSHLVFIEGDPYPFIEFTFLPYEL